MQKGRPPLHATVEARKAAQSRYLKRYYREHKEEIARRKQDRWKNDPTYREAILSRSRSTRALDRAKQAGTRIAEEERESADRWADARLHTPRMVMHAGKKILIFSTGVLGKHVCRSAPTIRRWIGLHILPGCTRRDDAGRYWFSLEFMEAVKKALRYTYLVNGHSPIKTFRQVIIEYLGKDKVVWEAFREDKKTAKGRGKAVRAKNGNRNRRGRAGR